MQPGRRDSWDDFRKFFSAGSVSFKGPLARSEFFRALKALAAKFTLGHGRSIGGRGIEEWMLMINQPWHRLLQLAPRPARTGSARPVQPGSRPARVLQVGPRLLQPGSRPVMVQLAARPVGMVQLAPRLVGLHPPRARSAAAAGAAPRGPPPPDPRSAAAAQLCCCCCCIARQV